MILEHMWISRLVTTKARSHEEKQKEREKVKEKIERRAHGGHEEKKKKA